MWACLCREALDCLKKIVCNLGTLRKLKQYKAEGFRLEHFKIYCLDADILKEQTIPETSKRNGLAERCNRTLLEMESCLLIDSEPSRMMRGAAILHAAGVTILVVGRGQKMSRRIDATHKI